MPYRHVPLQKKHCISISYSAKIIQRY